jgi:hypothetical protein
VIRMFSSSPGVNKEREHKNFSGEGVFGRKGADIIEVGRLPDIPPSLKKYLEKVDGEDYSLGEEVWDNQTGQALVTSSQDQNPKIVLPLTAVEYQAGLKESVGLAWRWLSEWSRKVRKMLGGQVAFRNKYDS